MTKAAPAEFEEFKYDKGQNENIIEAEFRRVIRFRSTNTLAMMLCIHAYAVYKQGEGSLDSWVKVDTDLIEECWAFVERHHHTINESWKGWVSRDTAKARGTNLEFEENKDKIKVGSHFPENIARLADVVEDRVTVTDSSFSYRISK